MGISLPDIVNVGTDACPILKYVFSSQEQQKRDRYYQSHGYRINAVATPIPLRKSAPLCYPQNYRSVVVAPPIAPPQYNVSASHSYPGQFTSYQPPSVYPSKGYHYWCVC